MKDNTLQGLIKKADKIHLTQPKKAIKLYKEILKNKKYITNEGLVNILINYAGSHLEMRERDPAEKLLKEANSIIPKSADYFLTTLYMGKGDLEKGFKKYKTRYTDSVYGEEYKWVFEDFSNKKLMNNLIDIKDKTVLIFSEQGFGDEIMFTTMYDYISKNVKFAYIELKNNMYDLMMSLFNDKYPNILFWTRGQLKEDEGLQKEFISKINKEVEVKALIGDIFSEFWLEFGFIPKHNVLRKSVGNKIGLVPYAGVLGNNSKHKSYYNIEKYISKNKDYFMLARMEKGQAKLSSNVHKVVQDDWGFIDTANWIIKNCEYVVSIDTSIAHLCGLLGIKCYVVLSELYQDWRWTKLDMYESTIVLNDMQEAKNLGLI